MAEEREQIIIDVQTNTESTILKMADLKEQIIGIQDARKELMRLQKLNGDLTAAEARTLALLDVSLKAARSSYEKLTNEAIREQRTLEQANGVITDSISGMKQALADATAQYNSLSKAEREAAEGQQLMQHIAELSNALAENELAFKNLKSNLNNVGDITETVKARIRELKEELTRLKLEGKDNTEGYKEMLEEAGRLLDGLNDVRKEIQDMANDTRLLSNVIDVFEGVAAGAGVLTGTMEALGVSTDSAEEATKKLVSIMTILKSLQTIQNALMDKSNGLYKLLYNTKSKVVTITNSEAAATKGANSAMQTTDVVVKKATFSFKGLWATLTANPLGLVAAGITAVIALFNKLRQSSDEAAEKAKEKLKELEEELKARVERIGAAAEEADRVRYDRLNNDDKKRYDNLKKLHELYIQQRTAAETRALGLNKYSAAYTEELKLFIEAENKAGDVYKQMLAVLALTEKLGYKTLDIVDAEEKAADAAEKARDKALAARLKAIEEEKRERERAANEIESYTQQVRTDTQEEELKIAEETYTRLKEEAEKYGWDTTLITELYEQIKKDIILKWGKKTKEDLKEQQETYDKEALKRIEETERSRALVTRDLQIENNTELQTLYQQRLDGLFEDEEEFESKLAELQHQLAIELFDADIATSLALIDNYTRELENFQGTADEKKRIEEALANERVNLSDLTTLKEIANSNRVAQVEKDNAKKKQDLQKKALAITLASTSAMSGLFNSLAETESENSKKSKNLKKAGVVVDVAGGSVSAMANSIRDLGFPAGPIVGGITVASLIAAGIANMKQIDNAGDENGAGNVSSAPAPNLSSLASITDSTQAVETLVGDEQIKAQQDTRVYVLESDITSTLNKVSVLESLNSF